MRKLEVGQRYRKVSSPSIVWEIVADGIERDGIPHVRLLSLADPTHSILIAERVVMHSAAFVPAAF